MKSLLLSQGIDVDNATVSLCGEVDHLMYEKVFKAIHILHSADYITFLLNTEGGYVSHGFAIHDLIKSAAPNAKMMCVGSVMSAGVIILMAGKEKISYPNTQFMIHYGSETNESGTETIHNNKITKKLKDLVENNVNVKRRTVNSWFNKETYFDAEHALRVGLIDRIVGESEL